MTTEPTPVHDEASGHYERHAAALTFQELRQREELAAELARQNPARLRHLLEGLGGAAGSTPNRVAWWALDALFPAPGDGPVDAERLRAEAATLGCELLSVGEVLRQWLLCGAASQGLLPEGAVAAVLQEQVHERARLAMLARWLRELEGNVLHEQTVATFLALLPDDVLDAVLAGDADPAEQAPPVTEVSSPALNGDGVPAPAEALTAEMATEPEERPWPGDAPTEAIGPADKTQELG